MGDALIAHELGKLGIDCHLEPLQSWQAAVYAYEPNLVIFNHLTPRIRDVFIRNEFTSSAEIGTPGYPSAMLRNKIVLPLPGGPGNSEII